MSYMSHPVQFTSAYPEGNADGSHLSPLELEWLERIPTDGWAQNSRPYVDFMTDDRTPGEKAREWTPAHLDHESAVIVYRGEFGLAMGAVRARHPQGRNGYEEDTFEASPFPGAWEMVQISRILLVRHPQTI
jgi:hypothetical protein